MTKDTLESKSAQSELNLEQLQLLLRTLETLHRQAEIGTVAEPSLGICYNWWTLLKEAGFDVGEKEVGPYVLVSQLSTSWPLRGDPYDWNSQYPVPHHSGYDLWQGPNRALRLSLIRHLLQHLTQWYQAALAASATPSPE